MAGVYLMTIPGAKKSTGMGRKIWDWVSTFLGNWVVVCILTVANAVLGGLCIFWHNDSSTSKWLMLVCVLGTTIPPLVMAATFSASKKPAPEGAKAVSYHTTLKSMRKNQRLLFWVQYVFTVPFMVLLYEVTTQQRESSYLISRVFFSLGIAFTAAGTDVVVILNETSRSADSYSCAWWSWGVWTIAGAALVLSGGTVSSVVQGIDTSMLYAAIILYVVVMPLLCTPGLADAHHKKWVYCTDARALGARLAVDLAARLLVTLSGIYWLHGNF